MYSLSLALHNQLRNEYPPLLFCEMYFFSLQLLADLSSSFGKSIFDLGTGSLFSLEFIAEEHVVLVAVYTDYIQIPDSLQGVLELSQTVNYLIVGSLSFLSLLFNFLAYCWLIIKSQMVGELVSKWMVSQMLAG